MAALKQVRASSDFNYDIYEKFIIGFSLIARGICNWEEKFRIKDKWLFFIISKPFNFVRNGRVDESVNA